MIEKRRKTVPAIIYRATNRKNKIDLLILENKTVTCRKKYTAKEAVNNLFENVQKNTEHPNDSFISTAYFFPKLVPVKYTESIACSCSTTRRTYISAVYLKRKYITSAKINVDPITSNDIDSEIVWETTKKIYRPHSDTTAYPKIEVTEHEVASSQNEQR